MKDLGGLFLQHVQCIWTTMVCHGYNMVWVWGNMWERKLGWILNGGYQGVNIMLSLLCGWCVIIIDMQWKKKRKKKSQWWHLSFLELADQIFIFIVFVIRRGCVWFALCSSLVLLCPLVGLLHWSLAVAAHGNLGRVMLSVETQRFNFIFR